MFAIFVLSGFASAGELSTGFQGTSWGFHEEFPAPVRGCWANTQPGVAWTCDQLFWNTPVTAYYFYENKRLGGVAVQAKGVACDALLRGIESEYGSGVIATGGGDGVKVARTWVDGPTSATWTYYTRGFRCEYRVRHHPEWEPGSAKEAESAGPHVGLDTASVIAAKQGCHAIRQKLILDGLVYVLPGMGLTVMGVAYGNGGPVKQAAAPALILSGVAAAGVGAINFAFLPAACE